jgi:hypothetical protein
VRAIGTSGRPLRGDNGDVGATNGFEVDVAVMVEIDSR